MSVLLHYACRARGVDNLCCRLLNSFLYRTFTNFSRFLVHKAFKALVVLSKCVLLAVTSASLVYRSGSMDRMGCKRIKPMWNADSGGEMHASHTYIRWCTCGWIGGDARAQPLAGSEGEPATPSLPSRTSKLSLPPSALASHPLTARCRPLHSMTAAPRAATCLSALPGAY